MATVDETREFISHRAKGYSFRKIAKMMGKSPQTLIDWSRKFQFEITNLKKIEHEALYEELNLAKESQVKGYAELLRRIKDEIDKRDFDEVPTDKLIDLYCKLQALLELVVVTPKFKTTDELKELQEQ